MMTMTSTTPTWVAQTRVHESIERCSGAVLVRGKDNDLLLLQRAHGEKRGRWVTTKGHLEMGETEMEAARREVCEETGMDPENLEFVSGFREVLVYDGARQGSRKVVTYYMARVPDHADVRPENVRCPPMAHKWVPPRAAATLVNSRHSRELIVRARRFLSAQQHVLSPVSL